MKALVLLADGCEEVEALTVVDVLRRGGVSVTTATLGADRLVRGAHGIEFRADALFPADVGTEPDWDLVALPGGMGCMRALRASAPVKAFLRAMDGAGKFVAAVCASPAALGAAGVLAGRRYCCYPGIEAEIDGGTYVPDTALVRDGRVITGTGPGTAMTFALALVEALEGKERRGEVAAGLLHGTDAHLGKHRHFPIVGTLGFILSPDRKKVLMVHRTYRSDDENLGKYNGVGGHLERGESIADCMMREIREETGLTVDSMSLRGTICWSDFGPDKEEWLGFVFLVDAFHGEPYRDNEEGTLSWQPIDAIGNLPMWKGDSLFLPFIFDADPRPFHAYMRYEGDDPAEWHYTRESK